MKIICVAFLVLVVSRLQAEPSGPPEYSAPTDYQVNTADISAVEFNTANGFLSFAVKGQRFVYLGGSSGSSVSGSSSAVVAAGFATLAELRRATTVTLRVEYVNDHVNQSRVDGITFHYDSLKP